MTVAIHFLTVFNRTGCMQFLQTVVQCLSFQFLLGDSLLSLQAENLLASCTIWSKLYLQNLTYLI